MEINTLGRAASTYNNAKQVRNKRLFSSVFADLLNEAVSADNSTQSGQGFGDMWKSRFPGAKYHVMDVSKISQGVWERNDFPFEKFFEEGVDESVLNWEPAGNEMNMEDSCVQTRLNSSLGGKSIIVPPELDAKMKNAPEMAQEVMDKVNSFIENHPTRPGRVLSYLIALDGNGAMSLS